jgi:hypothetical protein
MRTDNADRGFVIDCPFRVRPELARWLKKQFPGGDLLGFVRCFPHAGGWRPNWLDVLSAEELTELTGEGFGVAGYQIFRASRQQTAEHGRAAGEAMTEHAKAIGLPDGVTLFTDLEAFRAGADCAGYIDAWSRRVAYATESRGAYIGSNFLLPAMDCPEKERTPAIQGDRLYALAGISRYWLSMSQVATPSTRGPCLDQVWEYVLFGAGPDTWRIEPYSRRNPDHEHRPRFDISASRIDSLGGRLQWAVK